MPAAAAPARPGPGTTCRSRHGLCRGSGGSRPGSRPTPRATGSNSRRTPAADPDPGPRAGCNDMIRTQGPAGRRDRRERDHVVLDDDVGVKLLHHRTQPGIDVRRPLAQRLEGGCHEALERLERRPPEHRRGLADEVLPGTGRAPLARWEVAPVASGALRSPAPRACRRTTPRPGTRRGARGPAARRRSQCSCSWDRTRPRGRTGRSTWARSDPPPGDEHTRQRDRNSAHEDQRSHDIDLGRDADSGGAVHP